MPTLALAGMWVAMDRRAGQGDWDLTLATPATPAKLAGPVLSLRRQPATLAIEVGDRRINGALAPVTGPVENPSCFGASLDGRLVIDDGADTPALPASNLKIITAAVALDVLGPDFVFTTRATGALVGDTVEGDMFLVGGGDPLLTSGGYAARPRYSTIGQEVSTRLEALADAVAARTRRVTGRIVADESHFDAERFPNGWGDDVRGGEGGPLSALLLNDSRRLDDVTARVENPELYAARELTRLLRERGVDVAGEPAAGVQPASLGEIAAVSSVPLREVIRQMLVDSDNNTAELVLKQIGATAGGGPGSTLAGVAAVAAKLAEWGMPGEGLVIADGSGLDRASRVSCRTLIAVLDRAGVASAVFAGLPTPAGPGTLTEASNADAFAELGVDQRVRAKTGSLSGAKALSGWFELTDGRQVTFSLLINGDNATDRAHFTWRAMAEALAGFSGGPAVDQLALPGA